MNKKQLTAIRRIVSNGKSNNPDSTVGYGGYFDRETGKVTFTDGFSLVMFDDVCIEKDYLDVFKSEDSYNWHKDMDLNANQLFYTFNNDFHSMYDDSMSKNYSQKDINDAHKTMKESKDVNERWCMTNEFGTCYDIRLMRNVIESMGEKNVTVYFPKEHKPIVVCGISSMGLVMPVKSQ